MKTLEFLRDQDIKIERQIETDLTEQSIKIERDVQTMSQIEEQATTISGDNIMQTITLLILCLVYHQSQLLHNLACKGGAISHIRVQVNSLIREFPHAKLPYKQVTNTIVFNLVF
ncbi:Hypothetical_protein [Hexamita inflata]|uniref:Hypothetical_protein n=1 Tax=Hexamita inflata TaxID=28002 RepID=A0AA86QH31_9EUKA|nr:Hypothetical protein HINF_LOCUS46851 [Hexamita inflata]